MDAWFEEDEEIYIHPRDPHKRIDVLHSSRHVEVFVEGTKVADSHRPVLLFETDMPTRYYLHKPDVRMDLLKSTASSSGCPYKGQATYWSVKVGDRVIDDLAWGYETPLLAITKITGLVCFYNEKLDIVVDGVPQESLITGFAKKQ